MLFWASSFSLTNWISVSFFKFWEPFPSRPSFVQLSCPLVFGQQVGQRGLFSLFLNACHILSTCVASHILFTSCSCLAFWCSLYILSKWTHCCNVLGKGEVIQPLLAPSYPGGQRGRFPLPLVGHYITPMHLPTHPTPSPTFLTFFSLCGQIVIERDAHFYFITLGP